MNNYRKHVSFRTGNEIFQISKPILEAFEFVHFTFCRRYKDGSRAILTTTTESLYDLYSNKMYIFNAEYSKERKSIDDLLTDKNFRYYFQSDVINLIPERLNFFKKFCIEQKHYELQNQNIFDRFVMSFKKEEFDEAFIFFIPQNYPLNYSYVINNMEIFDHFRLYFLDKAQCLIREAEQNKLVKPFCLARVESSIRTNELRTVLEQMKINRYYVMSSNNYLTKQEMICATYLMKSYTAKEIAKLMNLSPRTIETYIEKIRQKFNFPQRSQLNEHLQSAFSPLQNLLNKT